MINLREEMIVVIVVEIFLFRKVRNKNMEVRDKLNLQKK